MPSQTTGHLDLTLMVAFHDAFRRDLGRVARTARAHRTHAQQDRTRNLPIRTWRSPSWQQ
jgi:hypothetical protein